MGENVGGEAVVESRDQIKSNFSSQVKSLDFVLGPMKSW